jgi:excisionase family DNA binding protein
MTTQPSQDLLTVKEVSNILRVNDSTLRRWIKNGAMQAVILPHLSGRQGYRIKRETLDTLLGQPQPR